MQIGVTQCCMWTSTLDDFLPAAGKAGYDVVELMTRADGDLSPKTSDADLKAITKRAADLGVRVFSLALMHLRASTLESGAAQQMAIEDIKSGLRIAKTMGAGHVLLTLGRVSPENYYDDAYRNGVETLRQSAKTADELGVDIAVEFVWNGFLFSPMEMKRFLDDVGHKRVGFYFDPGNMAVFQHPQHWVRILGKHTKLVHLKDWKGNALNGNWTPLLEGGVNFPAVMKELHAIGYTGPLTSEVDPAMASLADSAVAARKISNM